MKKLALSLAVLFAVGMVSCGGNKDNNAGDTITTEGVELVDINTPGDSATGDSNTQIEEVSATQTTEAPADKKDAKEDKKDDAAKTDAPAEGAETPAPEAGK